MNMNNPNVFGEYQREPTTLKLLKNIVGAVNI